MATELKSGLRASEDGETVVLVIVSPMWGDHECQVRRVLPTMGGWTVFQLRTDVVRDYPLQVDRCEVE